jgi:non-ribosomal peptide synthetase component F
VAGLAAQLAHTRSAHAGLLPPPLRPALRSAVVPLAFAQRRLWFLDQLSPGSAVYNILTPVRLTGALDLAALQASFNALVCRHETLRTTFGLRAEQPVQQIAAPLPLPLAIVDLRALPAEMRAALADRLTIAEVRTPFDLARGPLLRTTLLRLTLQEHMVLLTMHHIVSDGWSAGVLIRDLAAFYAARVTGQPVALPALPIQYADYALWQQDWLRGDVLDTQVAYWRRQLADAPTLDLPLDRPRPPVQTFRGVLKTRGLPPSLHAPLQTLSQRAGATLFMTLLAAFQTLLARHSGQDDIIVGSPIAGRTQQATEELIGFFVNTLVLRADMVGNPTFLMLLERVREVCLGAYAHQDLPFEQLVDALQPVRDPSRHPLFQVMFVLQNVPVTVLDVPGLTLRPVPIDTQTVKFDLSLTVTDGPTGLVVTWEYNTDMFDATTITRLAGHFQQLLTAVVADPAQHLAALPLLSAVERQQLLHEWNDTRAGVKGQGSGV